MPFSQVHKPDLYPKSVTNELRNISTRRGLYGTPLRGGRRCSTFTDYSLANLGAVAVVGVEAIAAL